jgi:hypothetical protein
VQNFRQVASNIAVDQLVLAYRRRAELWKEDTYLRDYPQGPFGEVESIMLRFPVKTVHETEEALREHVTNYDQHECVDYPPYKLLTEARVIVMNLMAFVGGERLGRVMINKIAPGGSIFPHADTPVHAEYWDRFHVVLESAPGVIFRAGDERVYMPVGTVWWFDNSKEHEVLNNSGVDRVHMVVDIRCSR